MLRRMFVYCIAVALTSLMACKKDYDEGGSGNESGLTHGCIQGVVIDGVTGNRVALPSPTGTTGMHVLIRNDLHGYAPMRPGADSTAEPKFAGEYHLCNIPLDEEYPFFVWVDGYLPYESKIYVRSTLNSLSGSADQDIRKPVPNRIVNIKLYPVGAAAKDFKINVTQNGAPVVGAEVQLKPTGLGLYDDTTDTNYVYPLDVRFAPQRITTDGSGAAVFAGTGLVIGGKYQYTVYPGDGGSSHDTVSDTVTVGLRLAADDELPYEHFVDLGHPAADLIDVSNSTQFNDYNTSGTIKYIFNRPIEIVPNTTDDIAASLSNAGSATLITNVAGNKASEQVDVVVTGNTLSLTPKFQTAPKVETEPGVIVNFSGIKVRPLGSPGTAGNRSYSPSVSIFGGVTPPAVATTLQAVGAITRTVTGSAAVTPDLQVRVIDQYGSPFTTGNVTMVVATVPGGATGQLLDDNVAAPSATSVTTAVNGAGTVTVGFTTGNITGSYVVTASYGLLTAVTFTITSQ